MALRHYTRLQHLKNIGDDTLMTELENNLKVYLDWGLLGIGGWFDVNIPTSGAFGGLFSQLRLVNDPSYDLGQIWESARKDWVWETGVEWSAGTGEQPIIISGTWVDSTFHDFTGSAGFEHHINYPLGRIVFDTAISTTSTVEVEHSYRWIQVYKAEDAAWWQELQFRSFRPDDVGFGQNSSGDWSIGSHHRIQMPCIIIEAVPRASAKGFELGNNALMHEQDVLFHILTENRWERNKIINFMTYQKDKDIFLFKSVDLAASSVFPLDYRGMLTGVNMYPDFVTTKAEGGLRWKKCTFTNVVLSEVQSMSPKLHEATARATIEVVIGSTADT